MHMKLDISVEVQMMDETKTKMTSSMRKKGRTKDAHTKHATR